MLFLKDLKHGIFEIHRLAITKRNISFTILSCYSSISCRLLKLSKEPCKCMWNFKGTSTTTVGKFHSKCVVFKDTQIYIYILLTLNILFLCCSILFFWNINRMWIFFLKQKLKSLDQKEQFFVLTLQAQLKKKYFASQSFCVDTKVKSRSRVK